MNWRLIPLMMAAAPAGAQMAMPNESPPADARDPHAYADGADFARGDERTMLADQHRFRALLIDQLEFSRVDGETIAPYDLEGWYGLTYDRAVLRAEGQFADGTLDKARTELLWAHAIAPYWDTRLGIRHDSGTGPNRSWLAAGIEGLAPYRINMDITAYVGESNRTALRLEASYDMLLTQRLVVEPRIEANWYGRSDAARSLGSGLADISLALRLRYEVRRELAPYIGIEWSNRYGGTERQALAAGKDPSETRLMLGLHFWF